MPYVEDMSSECFTLLRDKKQLNEALKLKVNQCNDLKKAFTEASQEIKHQTEYAQKIEKDNCQLREMYAKVSEENEALTERLRLNELKFKHEKITKKPIESDWWTPKRNIEELFIEGTAYRVREDVQVGVNLLRLWSGNKSYTVQKADFMPCNNRGQVKKHAVKHTDSITESGK
jgi:predicted nuclease with TOPRIM domain